MHQSYLFYGVSRGFLVMLGFVVLKFFDNKTGMEGIRLAEIVLVFASKQAYVVRKNHFGRRCWYHNDQVFQFFSALENCRDLDGMIEMGT